jgi:hypothetical protein
MALDHVEFVYTTGMDAAQTESYLADAETGTLALARDDEAYALPMAIHWDGTRLLLRLGSRPESEKLDFLDSTTTATVVCYGYESPEESWSVLVRGPVAEVGDPDDATINDLFPPLRIFDEDTAALDPVVYALEPAEITGRRTVG